MGTHKKQMEAKPIIITRQTAWLILRVCMSLTPHAYTFLRKAISKGNKTIVTISVKPTS